MVFTILTYLVIIVGTLNLIRIVFFMVGSDIYTIRQAKDKKKITSDFTPTFTVIIPAHNEKYTVINAIDSVVNAVYPKEKLEILISDDGSTDNTPELVKKYIAEHKDYNIKFIQQENAGKAHALNNAIKNFAKGELIMCLDADSTIRPDALKNATRYFLDKNVVALSSNVKIRNTGTLLNLIQQFEYLVCYQMKRAQTIFNIEYIIGGIGSTFRHSALKKVDYYDTDTITEDIDLTLKLIKEGNKNARVIYGSDVVTYTESVLDINGLIRQRYRWKHGRSQTFLKNTELFFSKSNLHNRFLTWIYLPYALLSDILFFLEPFIVGYIAFSIVYYRDWITLISAFAVIATYIVMNVLAEDTIPWRERVKLALIAPTMYFLFYLLSFVEYVALIKSYSRSHELVRNVGKGKATWEHVARAPKELASPYTQAYYLLKKNIFATMGTFVVLIVSTSYLLLINTTPTTIVDLKYTETPAINIEEKTIIHTVEKGEYLRLIAEKYYGDESDWKKIIITGDPNLIYPGQEIIINK